MKLHHFCAKCGIILDSTSMQSEPFLCANCGGKIPIEPGINLDFKIDLLHCIMCNAYSLRKGTQEFAWQFMQSHESLLDFISRLTYSYIFIPLEKKSGMNYTLYMDPEDFQKLKDNFTIILTPVSLTQDKVSIVSHEYLVKIYNIHCPSCADKIGGRFNAIVQLRIQNPKDKARLDEIMDLILQIEEAVRKENNENFISRIEPVTNGFDLKVSTNTMAKIIVSKLTKKYHFEIKSSNRLIGRDSETSADLYRRSTLLRLLPVEKGDYILWEDDQMVINKITHNRVLLQNVVSGESNTIKFGDFQKKRWLFQKSHSNVQPFKE